jgi:hypothetical protein
LLDALTFAHGSQGLTRLTDILRADKGGATVVKNQVDYNTKMIDHLSQCGSYRKLSGNPITKIMKEVKRAIKNSNLDERLKK